MAYATYQDVQELTDTVNLTFGVPPSKPKITQANVTAWIAEYESEINMALKGQGYPTIPSVGVNDALVLRQKVSEATAYKAYSVAYQAQDLPEKVRNWRESYNLFLSGLKSGKIRLIDQDPTTTEAGYIQFGSVTLGAYDYSEFDV